MVLFLMALKSGDMGERKGKEIRKPRDNILPSHPPPPSLINNSERGTPQCCEVFVNGRANCNKQEWCLSPLTGTTLLIRLAQPDGTLGKKREKERVV